ncbi:response regulator [Wohlfahrtiimonas chitiniclastica]|uniref:response regulator n=1 Tax=Wohlfahrtiimonas chitiniclastica TaxID=400946 RepID=UPI001BCF912A|nr:response regulator [Wohlfahrtiimonas chitiniclastica]MBS7819131.1 response regulator transcription factor [Wohlfahrtiimonas chitiniclastica]
MKIHIVDDEIEVRESCQFLIEQLTDASIEPWENGEIFVQSVALYEPAVVILDLRMPKMDGASVVEYLKREGSVIAPIILTGHGELSQAVNLLKQGVVDFLEKPVSSVKLAAALQHAEAETHRLWRRFCLHQQFLALTEREQQVSRLVYEGKTNREIAEQLHVSVRTVEVQRASAMKKLGAETLAEFIVLCNGLCA